MTSRRPPVLPWVAITQTTRTDGTTVTTAELQGYGPITADYAQHLLTTGAARAPDAPTGREPDPGATTHPRPTRAGSTAKSEPGTGTCRFPGCCRAAHRVDLDHTIPYPRGLTVRHNLGGLCRRHHNGKTRGAWHLEQSHDGHGTMTWTSRLTGRTYTTHPRGPPANWTGTTSHQ